MENVPARGVAVNASAYEHRRAIPFTRECFKHGFAVEFGFGNGGVNRGEVTRNRDERVLELRHGTEETPERGEAFCVVRANRLDDCWIDAVRTRDTPLLATDRFNARIVAVWTHLSLLDVKRHEVESGDT